jgi:hypothetical protein
MTAFGVREADKRMQRATEFPLGIVPLLGTADLMVAGRELGFEHPFILLKYAEGSVLDAR